MTSRKSPLKRAYDEIDGLKAERDRYRKALEWIADAERAEYAEVWEWAVNAHDRAREALQMEREGSLA